MIGNKRLLKQNSGDEDTDPMHSLGNLADAMLVLAVGIMLALIKAWQLDMSDIIPQVDITSETVTTEQSTEDYGFSEYGKVYVDKDDNYYMVENE